MKTFKRKTFYTAVLAAVGAMGVAGSASAVQLSQDGTGQVLIYPYYTTRTAGAGDFATYLNVVNTTNSFKAVKVRFLEGKNSREVLDFNLYLSPFDVWTGAVSKTADGAKLASADKSCTTSAGSFAASVTAGTIYSEFVNYAFVGASTDVGVTTGTDGEDQSLDRVREGYFEIIEMGTITSTAITTGLKHNSAGTPANCAVIATIDGSVGGIGNNYIEAPTGGLIGGASLINVQAGSDYGYDPVVLEDFFHPLSSNSEDIWFAPGSIFPDMTKASPPNSNVFYYHQAVGAVPSGSFKTDTLSTFWTRNVDAVSAVLMRDSVMNTYVLDAATLSATDWIVTFPTKRHYVSANAPIVVANDPNGTQRLAPFHNFFWTGGSCDPVTMAVWDREEQTFTPQLKSSPPPPTQTGSSLCWEANVITFKNSAAALSDAATLLGSKNRLEVAAPSSFEHGWGKLSFGSPLPMVGNSNINFVNETYNGLPVVGFMVQDFLNSGVTIGGLPSASAYGGNFNHKYTRSITGGNVTP